MRGRGVGMQVIGVGMRKIWVGIQGIWVEMLGMRGMDENIRYNNKQYFTKMSDKGNYISEEKVTSQESKYVENVLCPMQGNFF